MRSAQKIVMQDSMLGQHQHASCKIMQLQAGLQSSLNVDRPIAERARLLWQATCIDALAASLQCCRLNSPGGCMQNVGLVSHDVDVMAK